MIEAGLSDFYRVKVTSMATTFEKLKPGIILYKECRKFCNVRLPKNLLSQLSTENIRVDSIRMERFLQICINNLDKFAPCTSLGNPREMEEGIG